MTTTYDCAISPCGAAEPHPAHVREGMGYSTVRYGWVDKVCPGQRIEPYTWTVAPGQAVYLAAWGDAGSLGRIIVAERPVPLRLPDGTGRAIEAEVIDA